MVDFCYALFLGAGLNLDGQADESQALDDFPDLCLKFISEILMEEEICEQNLWQDSTALEAAEKSLLDVIGVTDSSVLVDISMNQYLIDSNRVAVDDSVSRI